MCDLFFNSSQFSLVRFPDALAAFAIRIADAVSLAFLDPFALLVELAPPELQSTLPCHQSDFPKPFLVFSEFTAIASGGGAATGP
jgi:hypothetical protein